MDRKPIPQGTKPDMENMLNSIMDGSLGVPIYLSSAPTTAKKDLKENQIGFDGSNLFITLQGTTYKLSLTAV